MAKKSSVERVASAKYLYSDGTLVECFEERRDGIQIGETVDITYGYAKVEFHDYTTRHSMYPKQTEGRIIFSRYIEDAAMAKLAKGAKVRVFVPSVERGSENTKRLGIEVGHVSMYTKYGWLKFDCMPNVMGSDFTIQTNANKDIEQPTAKPDSYYPGALWGYSARMAKITDLRPKTEVATNAA